VIEDTCAACSGSGVVRDSVICSACMGSGSSDDWDTRRPPEARERTSMAACEQCHGTGSLEVITSCPVCDGTGRGTGRR
jgi:RecJ-like exonuclease